MDENENVDDQGLENQDNGEQDQSDDNAGGAGDDTPKVKIGDKEYTVDEATKLIDKGGKYDELLPDYTIKSQKLSEYEKSKIENNNKGQEEKKADENIPYFLKPGWKPQTYEDLGKALKDAAEMGQQGAVKFFEDQKTAIDAQRKSVDDLFGEFAKSDKDFDESDFSDFVLKHSANKKDVTIDDLKSFYSVYKDVADARKLGEETALRNKEGRNDKVNKGSSGGGSNPNFTEMRARGMSVRDIAKAAFEKLK